MQRDSRQPDSSQPDSGRPSSSKQGSSQPVSSQPGPSQPSSSKQGSSQPVSSQPDPSQHNDTSQHDSIKSHESSLASSTNQQNPNELGARPKTTKRKGKGPANPYKKGKEPAEKGQIPGVEEPQKRDDRDEASRMLAFKLLKQDEEQRKHDEAAIAALRLNFDFNGYESFLGSEMGNKLGNAIRESKNEEAMRLFINICDNWNDLDFADETTQEWIFQIAFLVSNVDDCGILVNRFIHISKQYEVHTEQLELENPEDFISSELGKQLKTIIEISNNQDAKRYFEAMEKIWKFFDFTDGKTQTFIREMARLPKIAAGWVAGEFMELLEKNESIYSEAAKTYNAYQCVLKVWRNASGKLTDNEMENLQKYMKHNQEKLKNFTPEQIYREYMLNKEGEEDKAGNPVQSGENSEQTKSHELPFFSELRSRTLSRLQLSKRNRSRLNSYKRYSSSMSKARKQSECKSNYVEICRSDLRRPETQNRGGKNSYLSNGSRSKSRLSKQHSSESRHRRAIRLHGLQLSKRSRSRSDSYKRYLSSTSEKRNQSGSRSNSGKIDHSEQRRLIFERIRSELKSRGQNQAKSDERNSSQQHFSASEQQPQQHRGASSSNFELSNGSSSKSRRSEHHFSEPRNQRPNRPNSDQSSSYDQHSSALKQYVSRSEEKNRSLNELQLSKRSRSRSDSYKRNLSSRSKTRTWSESRSNSGKINHSDQYRPEPEQIKGSERQPLQPRGMSSSNSTQANSSSSELEQNHRSESQTFLGEPGTNLNLERGVSSSADISKSSI